VTDAPDATTSTILHSRTLVHFADDSVAYAGHHLHENSHPVHTHSFAEIALTYGGTGTHHSLAGRQRLEVGDAVLLRPGVWHGYEDCDGLDLYNCCFSTELLKRELAWTREDPLLGYLLWTGPYSGQRRGMLTAHLSGDAFGECVEHLEALDRLRLRPRGRHRGDFIARLALVLGCVARAVVREGEDSGGDAHTHPAVLEAMRMMEARPGHPWSLTELAAGLHLAPGYLVRLFKNATGLPPMAYLSRHRVEVAATRLLGTADAISRIGESVGWPDQNYFARRFRAHYGMSASAYRSQFSGASLTGASFTGASAVR
jgi:AraC family transcriptional regulator, L-rhamnose operon transcriptional activator RhaR